MESKKTFKLTYASEVLHRHLYTKNGRKIDNCICTGVDNGVIQCMDREGQVSHLSFKEASSLFFFGEVIPKKFVPEVPIDSENEEVLWNVYFGVLGSVKEVVLEKGKITYSSDNLEYEMKLESFIANLDKKYGI